MSVDTIELYILMLVFRTDFYLHLSQEWENKTCVNYFKKFSINLDVIWSIIDKRIKEGSLTPFFWCNFVGMTWGKEMWFESKVE